MTPNHRPVTADLKASTGDGRTSPAMAGPKPNGERGEIWYASGLRFECTQCGECCSGTSGIVEFNRQEAEGMAKALALSYREFLIRYATPSKAGWILKEVPSPDREGSDCILLAREPDTGLTRCTVHRERPAQCRTWPFWPENLETPQTWQAAAAECEGMNRGDLVGYREIILQRDGTPEPGTPYDDPDES